MIGDEVKVCGLIAFSIHGQVVVVEDQIYGSFRALYRLAEERGYYMIDKIDGIWRFQGKGYPNNKLHIFETEEHVATNRQIMR